MDIRKILLFSVVLLIGLTVVSAADIVSDDSVVAVETPQVEQQVNPEPIVQEVQSENDNILEDEPSNDVVISSDVTIDSSNVDNYNNKKWTVNQGVTVTGTSGVPLSNVAIKVAGNQVTLKDLQITSQDISDYLINATSVNNLRIDNSQLTITNVNNIPTMGIYVKDADTVVINGTTLTVNAPAQAQNWYPDQDENWYSVLEVSGVYSDHSNNVKLENSTVSITNTTENLFGTTMPAVTVRNNSNVVSIKNNTISSTGAQYVYGIMMNDLASNVDIENNIVSVNGLYYVAGIDASTASNSKVSKNTVTAISEGATTFPDGYESLAYGIISDTYTSGNTANHICQNTIDISAIVCYGIEMYRGMNNFVCSNDITATGIRVMGVALAYSTNNKIINNNMSLTGYPGSYHPFYEEITPINAGIIFTKQSNGNWIQGNDIQIAGNGDLNTAAINLQNSTTATINGNYLKAVKGEDYYGNEAIKVDSSCSNMNIGTNNGVVLYNCDCGCMSNNNNNGGVETESTNQPNTFYKTNTQNIKKESDNIPTVIINDDNYTDYGRYQARFNACEFTLTKTFESETNIIYNFTSLPIKIIKQENIYNFHVLAINCLDPGQPITVWTTEGNINGLYAPLCDVITRYNDSYDINITNSTLYSFHYGIHGLLKSFLVENNTFYSNEISSYNNAQILLLKNNRFYTINSDTQTVTCGLNNDNENWTLENNGPNYENAKLLNNDNYNNYFNEDNTLKDEYTDSVLFAAENITNPVIINVPVTLTALRGVGGYSTVNFIEGSDNSVIEDSFINKVTLNDVSNIKVYNNKLLSDDSIIEVINSVNTIIENNTINTKNTYTITLDEDSMENIVRNNELIASELTGDSSVQSTDDNTVESNTPLPVPELKIDTTEFTVGTTTTIQASIYLGKEISSDINAGKVVFKVDGKTLKDDNGKVIYAKIVNGTATIENYKVPMSWTNETVITAIYSGSTKCEALNTEETITISKNEPTITTEDITTTKSGTINITASVTDGVNSINVGKVIFKINGKTVKDANGKVIYAQVINGIATIPEYTLPENLKAGTYTITATYTSATYGKLETSSTLTITA